MHGSDLSRLPASWEARKEIKAFIMDFRVEPFQYGVKLPRRDKNGTVNGGISANTEYRVTFRTESPFWPVEADIIRSDANPLGATGVKSLCCSFCIFVVTG